MSFSTIRLILWKVVQELVCCVYVLLTCFIFLCVFASATFECCLITLRMVLVLADSYMGEKLVCSCFSKIINTFIALSWLSGCCEGFSGYDVVEDFLNFILRLREVVFIFDVTKSSSAKNFW